MKAKRNKTINITVEDGKKYLDNCICEDTIMTLNDVMDKTIIGDKFCVLKKLPPKSIDLLI